MTYALDTSIISRMLRKNAAVLSVYRQANDEGHVFVVPVAVFYEIRRGLLAANAVVQMQMFTNLCKKFDIVEMNIEMWEIAAQIWSALRKSGNPLGRDDGDIFIAAQCISNGYTLVTDNARDFSRIDGLRYIAWPKN